MRTREIIWWVVCEVAMLIGAFVSLRFMLININFYRMQVCERVDRLVEKGNTRTDAIALISFRRKNELLRAIGYGTIVFVFVYIAVDILFRYIIGG